MDKARGGTVYLGFLGVIDVKSKFNIKVSVDASGAAVDKVVVNIPGITSVEITQKSTTNTWDTLIDLGSVNLSSIYALNIYAQSGNLVSDTVTQTIKVTEIVQQQ